MRNLIIYYKGLNFCNAYSNLSNSLMPNIKYKAFHLQFYLFFSQIYQFFIKKISNKEFHYNLTLIQNFSKSQNFYLFNIIIFKVYYGSYDKQRINNS